MGLKPNQNETIMLCYGFKPPFEIRFGGPIFQNFEPSPAPGAKPPNPQLVNTWPYLEPAPEPEPAHCPVPK